ncbi:hypothetical protein [Brevibacterium album]|uniref:hypothetical protein n=1 Tax=Brevibacterium album TaxID=417948 RepID=UPI00041624AF|nr:hypothetical protein [Brevibacterium album]
MKTTAAAFRTRTALTGLVLGAGLILSACGSDDAAPAEEGAAQEEGGQEAAAQEEAAEAPAATAEDLTAAIEALGYTAQATDASQLGEMQSAMGDISVEPAECEAVMNAGMAAAEGSDASLVVGMPADPTTEPTVVGMAYGSADEAASPLSANQESLGSCSEVTVTMQGMEVSSSTTEVSADVEGADAVFATEATMDLSGQEMTTRNLVVQKGSALVTLTGVAAPGAEGADMDSLAETAASVVAELP